MKRAELIEEHGKWLRSFEWHYFATLTFRQPVSKNGTRSLLTSYFERLSAHSSTPICMYWASEAGRHGLRLHAHCLIMGISSVAGARDSWWAGAADFRPYDPSGAAAFYISKTLGLDIGDWDILGTPSNGGADPCVQMCSQGML